VEPVFGQIKFGMGFQRFLYRGSKNVRSEWNTVCAAFNLKKIAALIMAKRVPLGGGDGFSDAEGTRTVIAGRLCRFMACCAHLFRVLFLSINGVSAPLVQCV
jgi:hypothetical protein